MEKIIILLLFFTLASTGNEDLFKETKLKETCLDCHTLQQIPNTLIYRRYLMKYSTKERIAEAMFSYLKKPTKATSIMPPQFFLKFSMKEDLSLNEKTLRTQIQAYIERFNVKKYLIVEDNSH